MRIVQISGTRISQLGGSTSGSARRMAELVNALAPDLVAHTGDVTILDPGADADRVAAWLILDDIAAPLGIMSFISAWNEYLWPSLVMRQVVDAVVRSGLK